MKRKTTEQFVKESRNVHGDKYDYSLVDYKNNKTKVKIICPEHGVFEQLPNKHSNGSGCRKCVYDNNSLGKDVFIERSRYIHGDKYDYSLVDYKNSRINVKIICPEHGVFEQKPGKHLIGRGCSICGGSNKLTREQFIRKSREIHGDIYDYSLVDYKNHKTKVKIICPEHGVFEQLPLNNLKGYGCYKCIGRGESINDIKKRFIKVHDDKYDYSLFKYYKNKKDIIDIICDKHGIFNQSIRKHLSGNGCPVCKESKGEKKIRIFLENKNIKYKREKKFENCRNTHPLPFDFYLPKYNTCIEYDGRQHHEINDFFGGIDGFKKLKKNDNIKTLYCDENNIDLLRISYKDYDNIENIIKNKLYNYEIK